MMYKLCATVLAFVTLVAGQAERDAIVTKQELDVDPSGQYSYAYETSNGISANEAGVGGQSATGGFSYQSPEGETINIQYVSDENGFRPTGTHIPEPPPIPDYIVRALEYIAANPPAEDGKRRR